MHLLLGIGNDLLGDDGVGPYIADHFRSSNWITINAGIVPENFISPVRKQSPDGIVIVDAVEMGLKPGSIRIIPPESIKDCGTGTHQIALNFITDQFLSFCPEVIFIGIQPGSLDPDSPLTDPVRKAADCLLSVLPDQRFDTIKKLQSDKR